MPSPVSRTPSRRTVVLSTARALRMPSYALANAGSGVPSSARMPARLPLCQAPTNRSAVSWGVPLVCRYHQAPPPAAPATSTTAADVIAIALPRAT